MFLIRSDQIEVIVAARLEAANQKLVDYARARFPRRFAHSESAEIAALVAAVRSTSRRYGINKEQDVATFVDLSIMYGEDFHEVPWAARVLQSKDLDSDAKITGLRDLVALTGVNL